MRIVYLNPIGQLGGAESALLAVLANLRKKRPDWQLCLIVASEGSFTFFAKKLDVTTEVLFFPEKLAALGEFEEGAPKNKVNKLLALTWKICAISPSLFQYIKKLKKKIEAVHPDLVYSNGFKMHLLGLFARPHNTPVIWHVHDFVSNRPIMSWLFRHYAKGCAAIIANSQSVARDIQQLLRDQRKVHTVYNTVDLTRFSPEGATLNINSLAGLPPAKPKTIKVGFIGTFARWKGQEVFLKALSIIPQDLPLRGYVIGGPIYETENSQYALNELKDLAKQFGIPEKVGFTGFLEDSASAIRSLDIVVHASTRPEPFGLVIIEAMACGKPVIASKAGGPEEIIVDGENGLFHTPGDAKSLADGIMRLAENPELRKKLGENGRKTVEEKFNSAHLAERILPIYEEVLASKS